MKYSKNRAVLICFIYAGQLFAAATSSEAGSFAHLIDHNTLTSIVSGLLDKVQAGIGSAYNLDPLSIKNGDYLSDPITYKKLYPFGSRTSENEDKLREIISHAFDNAWEHYVSDASLAPLKQDIKSTLTAFFIENDFYQILTTCYCITPAKRISFTVSVAQQVMLKFPNPHEKIIITAFASGLLLQEYLLLQLLTKHGYDNIVSNFVDFGYPDPVAFRRLLNQLKQTNPEQERIELKHYKQEIFRASGITEEEPEKVTSDQTNEEKKNIKDLQRDWIQENKELFPEFAELFGDDYFGSPLTYQKAFDRVHRLLPGVKLRSYKNMHDYIHFVQQYPANKADVLSIIDPDLTVFDVAPFPSQANLLGLVPSEYAGEGIPDVFITLAKDQPVQLYVIKEAYEQDPFLSQDVVEKIREKIIETDSDKKMAYTFRDWLIKYFGSTTNVPHIKSLLKKDKALLEEASTSAQQIRQIFAELEAVHENIQELLSQDEEGLLTDLPPSFSARDATVDSALNYVNELEAWLNIVPNDAFKLVWYSDPHLAFQELVRETAKDDALIYLYYKYNTPSTRIPVRFEQVTKSAYIDRDVFGPIVGTSLLKEGVPPKETNKGPSNNNAEEQHESEISYTSETGSGSSEHSSSGSSESSYYDFARQYARVNLETGKLITWDDIKESLPLETLSVAHAVEENLAYIHKNESGKKELFLNYQDISSLEGLDDIPGIDEVQELHLEGNQLKVIPAHAFSKFKKISFIDLNDNPIEYIDDTAFENLPYLYDVSLRNTALSPEQQEHVRSLLPPKTIAILSSQHRLPEIHTDASGRKSLYLSGQISSLEGLDEIPGIEEVQSLYLTNNTFNTFPPHIFSKLRNLQYITLDYNPLINGSMFQGLNNFNMIFLEGHPSEEEKERIRHTFPYGIHIRFFE